MARLIDADALKIDFYDEYETEDDAYAYGYVSKHQIDMAPTIDAVSVVRGEWIEQHENGHGFWVGVCSRCGEENLVDNYCPNCGAKMDGKRKESE